MKKIMLCLIMILALSINAIPAFAMEPSTPENPEITEEYTVNGLLWLENYVGSGLSNPYYVTPTAGANLNVWVNPTSGTQVRLYLGNSLIYDNTFTSEQDVTIATNCQHQQYKILIGNSQTNTWASLLFYEWY